jgi:hypothetical protein
MKHVVGGIVVAMLLGSTVPVWAKEGHDHGGHDHGTSSMPQAPEAGAAGEQTLTGEVTDVFCYLSHPAEGLGPRHAGCAKKCINSGLPVAIKVGDQLYLATMANHEAANKTLAAFAGQQVTVHGKLMEQDGQRLVAITHVEKAE